MSKSKEEQAIYHLVKAQELFDDLGWGDLSNYARGKECYMAYMLGHTVGKMGGGPDAVDKSGNICEYKTTTLSGYLPSGELKSHTWNFNGMSYFPTWKQQKEWLCEHMKEIKGGNYFAIFERGKIVTSWRVESGDLLPIMIKKLRKKYPKLPDCKDPRPGVSITLNIVKELGYKLNIT
jgi:hypothetical protein